jgi:hypothetical protein
MRFLIATSTAGALALALLSIPIIARKTSSYEVSPRLRELTTIIKGIQKYTHEIMLVNAPLITFRRGPFPVGVKI